MSTRAGYRVMHGDRLVAHGTGIPPELGPGETLVLVPDVDGDEIVRAQLDRQLSVHALARVNTGTRAVAMALKALAAERFLAEVPEPDEHDPLDLDLIDPQRYRPLHEEYWATLAQVDWSPWDLARRIVDRAHAASAAEAGLRRRKLAAEASLENLLEESSDDAATAVFNPLPPPVPERNR